MTRFGRVRSLRKRALYSASRLLLKAKIIRTRQSIVLQPDALGRLLLFQYNVGSAAFYSDTVGQLPVRLADSPHAAFAVGASASQMIEETLVDPGYRSFLKASWSALPNRPPQNIDEKVRRFWKLTKACQEGGAATPPITVTRLPGKDDIYIVDGNHRAAVAFALRLPLQAYLVPFDLVFFRYLAPSEYYGSGHRGRPYQTIYLHKAPVIAGRRTDIFDRLDLVPANVLAGAAVLDVGSNFGMNALATVWRGAASVLGLEQSLHLANTATRLAVLNGLYPQASFRAFDVDKDALRPGEMFDVCFLLSVYQHLRNTSRLIEIVDKHVRTHVVFEGHPGTLYEHYAPFLESGLFTSVTKLGELQHSAADTLTRRRPLWLCTKPGASRL